METVVLAWVILVETDSPLLLGIFGALLFFGTLIAPYFGVLADRHDRRKLLLAVRAVAGGTAMGILVLSLTGSLEVWHVFVLASFSGIARTFGNVLREVLTADVVEQRMLANAIGLTRSASDVAQVVAPIIGGALLNWAGISTAFFLVVAMYLLAAYFAYMIRLPARELTGVATSVFRNLTEAGGYIRRNNVVLALLLMAFLVNFTALSLSHGLMPVFAKDVMEGGPMSLAGLVSALFAGAFLGSMGIAALTRLQRGGRFLIVMALVWHAALLVFSQSQWFVASLVVLLVVGIFQSLTMVTMATLLIRVTPVEFRGRVMGARSLAVYGLPMGLLVAGGLAETQGAPLALAFNSLVGIVAVLVVTTSLRKLWHQS
jgi:MFS family permease